MDGILQTPGAGIWNKVVDLIYRSMGHDQTNKDTRWVELCQVQAKLGNLPRSCFEQIRGGW